MFPAEPNIRYMSKQFAVICTINAEINVPIVIQFLNHIGSEIFAMYTYVYPCVYDACGSIFDLKKATVIFI